MRGTSEASDFVVAALQSTGLKFGTDGSVPALWGYFKTSHIILPPQGARTGDLLFFQTSPPTAALAPAVLPPALAVLAPADPCDGANHVGIVSRVDEDGRISFVEARDGQIRHSFADPGRPRVRRDSLGRILNTFLRPKRAGDPADTPNFAGEMLCGAARPRT